MAKAKLTKTLYFDSKAAQFVYIVWDGSRAKHHKLPKTIFSEQDAKKYVKAERLGIA